MAIAAQGLDRARRSGNASRARVQAAVERLGVLQLDAVNVVARTQYLVLFARLGPFDRDHLHRLAGPRGPLFEYWGHMASVQPVALHPLLRWRMDRGGSYGERPAHASRVATWAREHADYIDSVLTEVAERGPLSAAMLNEPRRRDGEWWGRRSVGRQALEHLFERGQLAAWRTPSFERIYDLPERTLPAEVLATPTPTAEDAQRALLGLAADALGVATTRDLADYFRIRTAEATSGVHELVEAGELIRVDVEGWPEPGYVRPGVAPTRRRRRHATLLSPFDSLIWDRSRTERLFGFTYRIEIYTPAAQRRYGYYVLPVLLGDQLVGRLDLKADRQLGALRVLASHAEQGVDPDEAAVAIASELETMATWLGTGRIVVTDRGDLAPALASAVEHRSRR
nr:crosslink repair DNA glycosylase YcaQ family protein [Rhabdothermincola salaria]